MKKKSKSLENPITNLNPSEKTDDSLSKEDLSEVVKVNRNKAKPRTFTLRLPDSEQQILLELVTEVNKFSQYKKISANDVIRALICAGKKMNPEKLVGFLREL